MNLPVIEAIGLHKTFRNGKAAVIGLNLRIETGQVVGLLGTNGSGKSTFIKLLLGMLKPTLGTIKLLGRDGWNLTDVEKGRLGYVPQEIALYDWLTVRQTIDYLAAFYVKWDKDFTKSLVESWGLSMNDRVGPMSAGQKQKLAIVLALGHRPDVLVLDEPVASLDPIARRSFLASLLEIASDEQHTILFSTHLTSDLERVASHVAVMKDGRLAYFGELDELKDRVKRLRFRSVEPIPSNFSVPGALHVEVSGHDALITIPSIEDRIIDDLENRFGVAVEVEDLNLEEIFVDMHSVRN